MFPYGVEKSINSGVKGKKPNSSIFYILTERRPA